MQVFIAAPLLIIAKSDYSLNTYKQKEIQLTVFKAIIILIHAENTFLPNESQTTIAA